VPAGTRRLLADPTASAVSRAQSPNQPANRETLGARHFPAERLYLAFEAEAAKSTVTAAFLLLTPAADAQQTTVGDVPLLVREILEPWTPGRVVAGAPPRLSSASASGIARARARSLTRIDVTPLLRSHGNAVKLGVAVTADGESGHGVTFVTGPLADAPRLEIYTRAPGPE
jgi:hypothetical protein